MYTHLKDYFKKRFLQKESLALHTTYKIGGAADALVFPKNFDEWLFLLEYVKESNIPLTILGNGSNVLISDKGLRGLVALTSENNNIKIEENAVSAGAGALLDKVIKEAAEKGLKGLENMSGIPASVGGAVIMNAGAYGSETFDCLESFEVITPERKLKTVLKSGVKYGYRSVRGIEGCIVLSAKWKLEKTSAPEIENRRMEVLNLRAQKQPLNYPSAGSVFKRPEGLFASKLIDEAGLKGLTVGGAKVSEKHAGFIVNFNNATACDVYNLIEKVKKIVFKKTGVKLETEQLMLGEF